MRHFKEWLNNEIERACFKYQILRIFKGINSSYNYKVKKAINDIHEGTEEPPRLEHLWWGATHAPGEVHRVPDPPAARPNKYESGLRHCIRCDLTLCKGLQAFSGHQDPYRYLEQGRNSAHYSNLNEYGGSWARLSYAGRSWSTHQGG